MPNKSSGSSWRARLVDSNSEYSDHKNKSLPPIRTLTSDNTASATIIASELGIRPRGAHVSIPVERLRKIRRLDERNTNPINSRANVLRNSRPRYLDRTSVGNGLKMTCPPDCFRSRTNNDPCATRIQLINAKRPYKTPFLNTVLNYEQGDENSESAIISSEPITESNVKDKNEMSNPATIPELSEDVRNQVPPVPWSQCRASPKTTLINADIVSHGRGTRGVLKTIPKGSARKRVNMSLPSRSGKYKIARLNSSRIRKRCKVLKSNGHVQKVPVNRDDDQDTTNITNDQEEEMSEYSEMLKSFEPLSTSTPISPSRVTETEKEKKPEEITIVKDVNKKAGAASNTKFVGTENSDQIEVISLFSPIRNREKDYDHDDEVVVVSHVCTNTGKRKSNKRIESEETLRAVAGGEVVLVSEKRGVRALRDLPHARPHCEVHPFGVSLKQDEKVCPNCYCTKCQKKAILCEQWKEHASLKLRLSILIS